jgi:hypothetical protein
MEEGLGMNKDRKRVDIREEYFVSRPCCESGLSNVKLLSDRGLSENIANILSEAQQPRLQAFRLRDGFQASSSIASSSLDTHKSGRSSKTTHVLTT